MTDPLQEHLGYGVNLRQAEIDRAKELGIHPMALVQEGIVLRHKVVFDRRRFEFARHRGSDDMVSALVVPARGQYGEFVDLVAWRPPDSLGSWLGHVGLLGEDQVLGPRFGPLAVHANVLDWLRADRVGVVVVDMIRAAPLLRDASKLLVATVEHGQVLRKALTLPAPQILVGLPEAFAA